MPSLADIRARLAQQETKSKGNFKSGDSAVYPHWNIDEDETAILRFLDDADTDNPFFWVERTMFKFPFNGVKESQENNVQASDKPILLQVPCMEMYGDKDEVLDEVRTWFKDPSLEEMGRKYWKKRTYLFQGFVHHDPMADKDGNEVPENPIRRFMISPSIFGLIKNTLMDLDIEDMPTDPENGLDYRIKKTTKGSYADYSSSSWARKETALTQEELDAIEQFGLYNLKDFLPKKPGAKDLEIIKEMFEASVEGEAYDYDKWGAYFVPYGMDKADASKSSDTATKAVTVDVTKTPEEATPVKEETSLADDVATAEEKIAEASESVDAEEAKPDDTSSKAQDILKMIRSRQK